MEFRAANAQDVDAIAALHAESWRNNYRGAYSDAFLDGDVYSDRRAVWSERLTHPSCQDDTVVAEGHGSIIGFVHTILDHDPVLGALLDNLHVAHDIKRTGIGTQLMAQSAAAVMARGTLKRLYLAVLEANAPAQAFYEARGGERVGQETTEAPGGGSVVAFLYAWEDPSVLLQGPTS